MAAAPSYLKKRKLGWYVQVAVPRELQPILGTSPILRSLRTRDEAEARKRRHGTIATIFSEFRQAAAVTPAPSASTPEGMLQAALRNREAIDSGQLHPRDAELAHEASVDDYLERQARIHGVDAEGHPKMPSESVSIIRRSYSALAGRHEFSLARLATGYLKEQEVRLTAQTIGDKRRRLDSFLEWFGGERECGEVTRKVAGAYITEVIQRRTQKLPNGETVPLSAKTRIKETSDLRSFFQWLVDRGRLDENPFDRMSRSIKDSTRGKERGRRSWQPAELAKVLHGIEPADPMWALTVIGAYTGMRREEAATLRVESIQGNVLRVSEGKADASVRSVPIHPALAPLLKQLAKTTKDGFLIPGLLRGGPDRKRGWYIGKRFGLAIRALGVTDPRVVYHAFRNTVVTQLLEAGIPKATIQLMVGHEREGVTLESYNIEGVSDKVKRAAMLKLTFGKRLDDYVAATGASVIVKASAKPRKK
jgi:integrase